MDRAGESKDFSASLAKRIEHLRRRKERSEAYCAAERSTLDAEQLKVAQSREEIDGMLKEAERAEKAYRAFADRKNEEDERHRQEDFARGQQAAQALTQHARQRDFAVVADFLRLAAQQYENGGALALENPLDRTEVAALVSVLRLMYAGGALGAGAMEKLADGSEEVVGSTRVTYKRLQNLVPTNDDSSDIELSGSESSAESDSADELASSSEGDPVSPDSAETDEKPSGKPIELVEGEAEIVESGSDTIVNGSEKADTGSKTKTAPRPENEEPRPPASYAEVVAMGPSSVKPRPKDAERPKPKPRAVPRPLKASENDSPGLKADRVDPKVDVKVSESAAKLEEPRDDEDNGFQVVTRSDRNRRKFYKK